MNELRLRHKIRFSCWSVSQEWRTDIHVRSSYAKCDTLEGNGLQVPAKIIVFTVLYLRHGGVIGSRK